MPSARTTTAAALLATGILCLAAPSMAEERLLVQDTDLLVVVDRDVACGQPTPITVRSSDQGVFTRGSDRMQRIVDGTRAILGFECARIPALNITGQMSGRADTVFTGTAGDQTQWLVVSEQTLAAAAAPPPPPTSPAVPSVPASTAVAIGADAVGGVRTGMTVDQVVTGASGQFSAAPRHLRDANLVVAGDEDCTTRLAKNERLSAGQRCMVTQLSEGEQPRAFQVILHQAVDQDQRDAIVKQLTDRFGPPARVERGEIEGSSWIARHKYVLMGWRSELTQPLEVAARPKSVPALTHGLEALVVSYGPTTEVTIWSTDMAVRDSGPQVKAKF